LSNVVNLSDHPKFRAQRQLITRDALMNLWSIKSVTTIKSYVKKGMPETRLPGGQPRYDPVACLEWIEEQNTPPKDCV
jgi:hypothetical protein